MVEVGARPWSTADYGASFPCVCTIVVQPASAFRPEAARSRVRGGGTPPASLSGGTNPVPDAIEARQDV
jgi:hypothetical protein